MVFCFSDIYVKYSANRPIYVLRFFHALSLLAASIKSASSLSTWRMLISFILCSIAEYLSSFTISSPSRSARSFLDGLISGTISPRLSGTLTLTPLSFIKSSKSFNLAYTFLYLASLASSTLSSLLRITLKESLRE